MSSITIKDVAARAGVGKATASRALNGLKHVSPEARARVQQAAEELSFAPDPTWEMISPGPLKWSGFKVKIL